MKKSPYEIKIIQKKARYHPDPTMIFNHLCGSRSATLLLETAEINKKNDLESIMIIDSAIRISSEKNNFVKLTALSKNGQKILSILKKNLEKKISTFEKSESMYLIFPNVEKNLDEDKKIFSLSVFDAFRLIIKTFKNTKKKQKAMFFGGLFSYDVISNFELLPILERKQKCPDFCFYLAETLLVLDHQKQTCLIQNSLFTENQDEYKRIEKRGTEIQQKLEEKLKIIPRKEIKNIHLTSNMSDSKYCSIIKKLQILIKKGEIFQVVPSRKFFLPCINPLSAYQKLKRSNPSPYMFFMQDKNFTLFGASPESSLKYDEKTRQVELYPIAGTRPRGRKKDGTLDLDLDSRIELEMRTNHKELAEHLMLVDLARNDLARICEPGSRYVSDLVRVDKYSHVMHLVSRVVGKLKNGLDALHAYAACMNMGTLTGAPKVKAMQLIAEYEMERRGSYGGAIGYFTDLGNLDTCITIRSAYVENNIATIQAGAGIVFNSIPKDEVRESLNKAQAVINAIQQAHSSV
ncbi:MAG: anthranilate synthase component 1 (plasmid) [Buchnera aphidicola (Brevicoryne brassicae)]|uniref:Anthranilate synthase component 1 n=1 Tax=Buchnera aphidicola (Brevicoryne brassicae) TaxID=911343 RepID=A0AAJ5TXN6_9GAMM|nr:MAG: anthranilate synthase component 1 [Buchnera aphidicola (Brevicoryne brassicae)]